MKQKKKDGVMRTYYLDNEVIPLIEEGANSTKQSNSEFLEMLAYQWRDSLNPLEELKTIREHKKKLQSELADIELQEEEAIKRAEGIQKWQDNKRMQKPKAIEIIASKILSGETIEAEHIAATWSRILTIPASQLIIEAMTKLKIGAKQ